MSGGIKGDLVPARAPARRPTHRASQRVRRTAWLALVAAAVAAVLALAVGLDPGGHRTAGPGASVPSSSPSPVSASESTSGSAAAPSGPTVTCWNGTSAARGACPAPTGQTGLASVFPRLDDACGAGGQPRAGRAEVFVCTGDGFQVRYARWETGFDRFAVFTESYGQDSTRWTVRGRFAGRAWTSDLPDPESPDRGSYRWAATYRSVPYSVEVVADDAAARTAGIASVRAVAASHVGR